MSTYQGENATITRYFLENWTDTDVCLDNADFNMPETSWVRLFIAPNQHFTPKDGYFSFSPTTVLLTGIVFIQIFTPTNIGPGEALRLADKIFTLLAQKEIDDVILRIPSIQRIGFRNNYHQVNVVTPYERFVIIGE